MAEILTLTGVADGTALEAVPTAYGAPLAQVMGSAGASLTANSKAYAVGSATARIYRAAVSPSSTDYSVTGYFRHLGNDSSKAFVAINMQANGDAYVAFYNRANLEIVVRQVSSGVDLAIFGTPQTYSAGTDYTITLSRAAGKLYVQFDASAVLEAATLGGDALSVGEPGCGFLGAGSSTTGQHLASLASSAYSGTPSNTAPVVTITNPVDASVTLNGNLSFAATATATDAESGSLTASIVWSSNVPGDGISGTGGSLTINPSSLAPGSRTITASVTDAGGLPHADAFTLVVGSGGGATIYIPEDGGDMDIIEYGAATTLRVPLRSPGGAVLTSNVLASGDVKLSKNGAAGANLNPGNATIAAWPVVNGHVEVPISAAEAQCAEGTLLFRDQDGTAFADRTWKFRTQNHPSAWYPNGAQGAGAVPSGGGVAAGALSVAVTRSDGEFLPGAPVGFSGGASARIASVSGTLPNLTLGFATGAGLNKAVAAGETVVSYVDALPDRTGMVLAPQVHTGATVPTVTALTNAPADSATLTNILNRIGAFTGSGNNTVFGFFRVLFRKDLVVPTDIGGSFNPATDSNEALEALAAGIKANTDNLTPPRAAKLDTVAVVGSEMTLSPAARNAVADSLFDREFFPGVSYRDVMLGRVNYTRTKLTNTTGTWSYTRNGQVLASGTYVDEASGKTLTLTTGS